MLASSCRILVFLARVCAGFGKLRKLIMALSTTGKFWKGEVFHISHGKVLDFSVRNILKYPKMCFLNLFGGAEPQGCIPVARGAPVHISVQES